MRLFTPGTVTITVTCLTALGLMTMLNIAAPRAAGNARCEAPAENVPAAVYAVGDSINSRDGTDMIVELPWNVVEGLNDLPAEKPASGI